MIAKIYLELEYDEDFELYFTVNMFEMVYG